jgi:hypothetical protein
MSVTFDTNMLLLLLDPKLPPPTAKDGEPLADHVNERINYLVAELTREHEKIIIPTPVRAEVLVRAGAAGTDYLNRLSNAAAFKIESFDQRCAIEVAAMTASALKDGHKAGGSSAAWQKVKFDRQIAATARVHQCSAIYTDDVNLAVTARAIGIETIGVADLPLPPEDAQLSIPWGLPEDDEAPPPA